MDGFIMENSIKMDDWGVPLFSEQPFNLISTISLCILNISPSFGVKINLKFETTTLQWFQNKGQKKVP